MNDAEISIVIINYKTPELVIDCLESIISNLEDLNLKIVVVDNNSNDNSYKIIKEWVDFNDLSSVVIVISSLENSGFSGGNNLGISSLDCRYYLLLNSDTLVRRGALQTLLTEMKDHAEVGIVSPRLEWPDDTPQVSCFKFHTPISELIASANTGLITKLLKFFNVPQPVCNRLAYCDWTSFACVLIRKEVFENIGLLDKGYFMYYEDVEFCYRVKQSGWKILNVPDAHVVHLRGGSSPVKTQSKLRKRLPRYYYESRTRYFYQVYGRLGLLMANIMWTLGFVIARIRQITSSSYLSNASEYQWRDIWINFGNPLAPYIHPDNYDKA